MKNDLIKSMKLLPYGINAKMNLVMAGVFLVLGLAMDWVSVLYMSVLVDYEGTYVIVLGPVFLACMMMFPSQLLMSQTLGSLVGASPYSRKLKTSLQVGLSTVWAVVIFIILIIMKLIETAVMPQYSDYIWKSLLFFAIIQALMMVYTTFVYRHFAASLVVLYVVMMVFGFAIGFVSALSSTDDTFVLWDITSVIPSFGHPVIYILLSCLIIAAAVGIWYLLSKLMYKQPLSKYAFGAAMKKMV